MSEIPDIAGQDVKSWAKEMEEIEDLNAERVARLMRLGMSEAQLMSQATIVRIEAIISVLPTTMRQQLELRYERGLGEVLEATYAAAVGPKIYKPGES